MMAGAISKFSQNVLSRITAKVASKKFENTFWKICITGLLLHAFCFIALSHQSPHQTWIQWLFLFLTTWALVVDPARPGILKNSGNEAINNEVFYYGRLFIFTVFFALMSLAHVRVFILAPYQVLQKSMLPGLQPGDIVLVEKISMGLLTTYSRQTSLHRIRHPWFRPIQTGDVIIFRKPQTDIDMNAESSFSNDILIKRVERIENNRYCVYGDNRENSVDSRDFGCIPGSKIIGRYVYKIPKTYFLFPEEIRGEVARQVRI